MGRFTHLLDDATEAAAPGAEAGAGKFLHLLNPVPEERPEAGGPGVLEQMEEAKRVQRGAQRITAGPLEEKSRIGLQGRMPQSWTPETREAMTSNAVRAPGPGRTLSTVGAMVGQALGGKKLPKTITPRMQYEHVARTEEEANAAAMRRLQEMDLPMRALFAPVNAFVGGPLTTIVEAKTYAAKADFLRNELQVRDVSLDDVLQSEGIDPSSWAAGREQYLPEGTTLLDKVGDASLLWDRMLSNAKGSVVGGSRLRAALSRDFAETSALIDFQMKRHPEYLTEMKRRLSKLFGGEVSDDTARLMTQIGLNLGSGGLSNLLVDIPKRILEHTNVATGFQGAFDWFFGQTEGEMVEAASARGVGTLPQVQSEESERSKQRVELLQWTAAELYPNMFAGAESLAVEMLAPMGVWTGKQIYKGGKAAFRAGAQLALSRAMEIRSRTQALGSMTERAINARRAGDTAALHAAEVRGGEIRQQILDEPIPKTGTWRWDHDGIRYSIADETLIEKAGKFAAVGARGLARRFEELTGTPQTRLADEALGRGEFPADPEGAKINAEMLGARSRMIAEEMAQAQRIRAWTEQDLEKLSRSHIWERRKLGVVVERTDAAGATQSVEQVLKGKEARKEILRRAQRAASDYIGQAQRQLGVEHLRRLATANPEKPRVAIVRFVDEAERVPQPVQMFMREQELTGFAAPRVEAQVGAVPTSVRDPLVRGQVERVEQLTGGREAAAARSFGPQKMPGGQAPGYVERMRQRQWQRAGEASPVTTAEERALGEQDPEVARFLAEREARRTGAGAPDFDATQAGPRAVERRWADADPGIARALYDEAIMRPTAKPSVLRDPLMSSLRSPKPLPAPHDPGDYTAAMGASLGELWKREKAAPGTMRRLFGEPFDEMRLEYRKRFPEATLYDEASDEAVAKWILAWREVQKRGGQYKHLVAVDTLSEIDATVHASLDQAVKEIKAARTQAGGPLFAGGFLKDQNRPLGEVIPVREVFVPRGKAASRAELPDGTVFDDAPEFLQQAALGSPASKFLAGGAGSRGMSTPAPLGMKEAEQLDRIQEEIRAGAAEGLMDDQIVERLTTPVRARDGKVIREALVPERLGGAFTAQTHGRVIRERRAMHRLIGEVAELRSSNFLSPARMERSPEMIRKALMEPGLERAGTGRLRPRPDLNNDRLSVVTSDRAMLRPRLHGPMRVTPRSEMEDMAQRAARLFDERPEATVTEVVDALANARVYKRIPIKSKVSEARSVAREAQVRRMVEAVKRAPQTPAPINPTAAVEHLRSRGVAEGVAEKDLRTLVLGTEAVLRAEPNLPLGKLMDRLADPKLMRRYGLRAIAPKRMGLKAGGEPNVREAEAVLEARRKFGRGMQVQGEFKLSGIDEEAVVATRAETLEAAKKQGLELTPDEKLLLQRRRLRDLVRLAREGQMDDFRAGAADVLFPGARRPTVTPALKLAPNERLMVLAQDKPALDRWGLLWGDTGEAELARTLNAYMAPWKASVTRWNMLPMGVPMHHLKNGVIDDPVRVYRTFGPEAISPKAMFGIYDDLRTAGMVAPDVLKAKGAPGVADDIREMLDMGMLDVAAYDKTAIQMDQLATQSGAWKAGKSPLNVMAQTPFRKAAQAAEWYARQWDWMLMMPRIAAYRHARRVLGLHQGEAYARVIDALGDYRNPTGFIRNIQPVVPFANFHAYDLPFALRTLVGNTDRTLRELYILGAGHPDREGEPRHYEGKPGLELVPDLLPNPEAGSPETGYQMDGAQPVRFYPRTPGALTNVMLHTISDPGWGLREVSEMLTPVAKAWSTFAAAEEKQRGMSLRDAPLMDSFLSAAVTLVSSFPQLDRTDKALQFFASVDTGVLKLLPEETRKTLFDYGVGFLYNLDTRDPRLVKLNNFIDTISPVGADVQTVEDIEARRATMRTRRFEQAAQRQEFVLPAVE